MISLYFGSVVSGINTALVLGMIAFIIIAIKKHGSIAKWGRLIALFIVVGTAISALSATRDAFMMSGALFTLTDIQAMVCSVAGGAIFLTGIVSIFFKKQERKRVCFYIISALFILQVVVIEVSRIAGII